MIKKKKLFKVKDGSYLIYFYGKVRGINTYSYGIESRANSLAKSYGINLINFYDNDVIIDCGANFGDIFTWSKIQNLKLKYISFEPSPNEFKKNFKKNFKIIYFKTSKKFAKFRNFKPNVLRIIAKRVLVGTIRIELMTSTMST